MNPLPMQSFEDFFCHCTRRVRHVVENVINRVIDRSVQFQINGEKKSSINGGFRLFEDDRNKKHETTRSNRLISICERTGMK